MVAVNNFDRKLDFCMESVGCRTEFTNQNSVILEFSWRIRYVSIFGRNADIVFHRKCPSLVRFLVLQDSFFFIGFIAIHFRMQNFHFQSFEWRLLADACPSSIVEVEKIYYSCMNSFMHRISVVKMCPGHGTYSSLSTRLTWPRIQKISSNLFRGESTFNNIPLEFKLFPLICVSPAPLYQMIHHTTKVLFRVRCKSREYDDVCLWAWLNGRQVKKFPVIVRWTEWHWMAGCYWSTTVHCVGPFIHLWFHGQR